MGTRKQATFLERLEVIAAGRKLTPWLTGIGWTTGDVDRVKTKGHVPGPEKLALLADKENVNLSWLLAGKGEPWIGATPLRVQEAVAIYETLSPTKRALLDEILHIDDAAVATVVDLLKALKKGGY